MKKIIKIIVVFVVVCLVAVSLTLIIGGGDVQAPDTSDLIPEAQAVPDDQNAYPHLIVAANAITLPQDYKVLIEYIEGKLIYDALIVDILQKNSDAFPLIDKALTFNRCAAPQQESPAYVDQWYKIALLLGAQTVHQVHVGQIGPAAHSAASLLHFGDCIIYDAQSLFDISPGTKVMQLGLNQVGDIARLESASKEDLRLLADALAAVRPLERGAKRAFQSMFQEVAGQIDGFRASKKSIEETFPDTTLMPFFIRKTTWFPGYMFKENETKARLAKLYRDTIQNFGRNYADMTLYDLNRFFGVEGQNIWWYYSRPNLVGRLFYVFTTPEVDTYVEGRCQMEGSIRATQIIVALKLFEKDNGTLPEKLDALCPAYLDSVPLDPFNGRPFRYNAGRGIVYSVSKDLKDSGGSTDIPSGEIYGPDYPRTWITKDGVFKINP